MQTRRDAQVALAQLGELQRPRGRGAAGTPGDGDEEGAQGAGHAVETRAEVRRAHGRLGGEELEGEVGGIGGEGSDFIGDFVHVGEGATE